MGCGAVLKPDAAVIPEQCLRKVAAGARQIVSKLDSYGLRPESKAAVQQRSL
jgi:hypothetical protein